jgi:opacity protein-like surface antigen
MRSLKLALLATAATVALSSAVFAADLIVDTPEAAPPMVNNSFNWDGAYFGAFLQGQSAPSAFGLGVDFGVNALMNNLVIGGDIEAVASTGPNFSGQLTGKVGGLISDSAMLYAYTGIGSRTATSFYVPAGVGVEFAVADNMGIKLEGQYNFDLTSSAQNSAAVKVGLNWHF